MGRTLIAGFGNDLRGDDGFGVSVIRRLEAGRPLGDDVHLMEVGSAGLRLVQELLASYDLLIIIDAMTRGGAPGEVYVREVEAVEPVTGIDLHLAIPSRALAVAKAMGALPERVVLVGCEPAHIEEFTTELSRPVQGAVDPVLRHIESLVRTAGRAHAAGGVAPCNADG
ncbi:MAG: hydrogenase maturation protease [Gemmatimonadales bacterium]|nr:hydrogenase maturation protease [Gemmatimonadales bacterium]